MVVISSAALLPVPLSYLGGTLVSWYGVLYVDSAQKLSSLLSTAMSRVQRTRQLTLETLTCLSARSNTRHAETAIAIRTSNLPGIHNSIPGTD